MFVRVRSTTISAAMFSDEPLNILYQNCTGRVRNIRELGCLPLDALFNRLKCFDTLQGSLLEAIVGEVNGVRS